jgi:8-oxo-dGTP diphosphatase
MKKQLLIVCGLAVEEDKILLIQRKDKNKDIHLKWELPGGKVDFGEKPEFALAREYFEETGISVDVTHQVPIIQSYVWDNNVQTFITIFMVKTIGGKFNKSDHHTHDIKWFKYNEIEWENTIIGTKELIDASLKHYDLQTK